MKNHFFKCIFLTSLLVFNLSAIAEDIDLFVGSPVVAADLPNVMIVMDNAANFSSNAAGSTCVIDGVATALSGTVGGIEQCALYKVINEIDPLLIPTSAADTPVVNIGMMMYNATNIRDINNANCGGSIGGCLVQPLVPLNKANKAKFLAWIKSWKTTGGAGDGYVKASGEATGAAMQETWAYFAGHTGISNRSYASIKPVAGCQKNYVIFVGNSYSASGTPGDSAPGGNGPQKSLLGTNPTADKNANPVATTSQQALILNGVATSCGNYTFPTAAHETKGFYADEWARYMAGQNITTYAIGVLGSACQAQYAALLSNMAAYGDGEYFPTTDYATLVDAFKKIVSQIQSVNSVFTSVSLPVSVNTQGTFLNQVYVGMFRPNKDVLPRWDGNLKQYKLGYIGGVLQLVDANSNSAISSNNSGFINECALSYWTSTTADNYWALNSKENCLGSSATSNTPDGNVVEKGAQGYMLRSVSVAARTVKTCDACSPGVLPDFTTGNAAITKSLLGNASMTDTERTNLIDWARGLNNKGDETFVVATAMRPSVHGDVIHSRPVAINYGTDVADVVVYYGGNDGVLRAVNGNRTGGSELWAFIAPEFYSKIKRIYDNVTEISFKGSTTVGALPKDYGFDGPVTAYSNATAIAAATKTWIFASMRRGGRAVYAFDVSTAASPSLKWKVGCPNAANDTGCSAGFTGLGQTWASPKVLKSAGYGAGASPMLIMGGGYDTCQDADPNSSCSSSSKGTKIYVLDADTGALLKTFNTDSSVVADVTVVPDNVTGLAKYAYTADLGGNVYRISGVDANTPIGTTAPGSWTITKVAALGGSSTDNRKFMFAPDVLDDNGTYVLLLGSGDREKPLASFTAAAAVANRFYMIKDKPADASWLTSENSTCGANVICTASLVAITSSATPTATELAAKKGWYLALASTEQVVTSAITVFNTVTFSTHRPTAPLAGKCTTLGTATVYNVNYTNAAATVGADRGATIVGGGLPPSPVAGMVTLDDGTTVPFIIGANPGSALQGGTPPSPASAIRPKSRVYWNIKK